MSFENFWTILKQYDFSNNKMIVLICAGLPVRRTTHSMDCASLGGAQRPCFALKIILVRSSNYRSQLG